MNYNYALYSASFKLIGTAVIRLLSVQSKVIEKYAS